MKEQDITNSTAIYLKALPTCNVLDTCDSCLSATDEENKSSTDKEKKSLNVTFIQFSLNLNNHMLVAVILRTEIGFK
jgi:hypothetical protein